MKIEWIPPGRVLVRFDPPKQEDRGIIIPVEYQERQRRDEIAEVLLVGAPIPKDGQTFGLPLEPGMKVWVHPAYGNAWRKADAGKRVGEIREYGFDDIRGVVNPSAADYD